MDAAKMKRLGEENAVEFDYTAEVDLMMMHSYQNLQEQSESPQGFVNELYDGNRVVEAATSQVSCFAILYKTIDFLQVQTARFLILNF